MTTEQTAQQLELAAQILRTGHPWGYRRIAGGRYKYNTPIEVVADGNSLSPLLATPPDNRPLHNPDNLTAEQVGVGYRLTVEGEPPHEDAKVWLSYYGKWCDRECTGPYIKHHVYRLPLSVPWPEPADPYAELKAAHAAGKVIQFRSTKEAARGDWSRAMDMRIKGGIDWDYPIECFRIKPEEPALQLPPPPPGMRWHREDGWTADDLPSGYRPLVLLEVPHKGDEQEAGSGRWFAQSTVGLKLLPDATQARQRTTRPLTFEHAGKTWTYHRPGDPMPCDGGREVATLLEDLDIGGTIRAGRFDWSKRDDGEQIIGWRYAEPQTKTVPLGPEDVPPGSVFRLINPVGRTGWISCAFVMEESAELLQSRSTFNVTFGKLLEEWQINRSLSKGQWNPDAWEPCSKTIPA